MSSQEKIAWESGALIKIPPGVSGMFGIVVLPGGVSLPRGSSLEFIMGGYILEFIQVKSRTVVGFSEWNNTTRERRPLLGCVFH